LDKRFLKESGVEAFTGNELIMKGALEAGAHLITGYPGSPVSDVFEAASSIAPLLEERGIVAQLANNEALAAARLNGARIAGLRAMSVMKSVGFHVAADGLAIGNLAETRRPEGGAVAVVGDDPWNETTQINSDSRFLSQHLHMPVLEPSTFQELKDWILTAFELSGLSDLYITYLLTTNQADGGATVAVRPHPWLAINAKNKTELDSLKMNVSDLVLIPPHTTLREKSLAERRGRLLESVAERGLNKILYRPGKKAPLGFVTSGLSYCYLEQALDMCGMAGEFPILRLGMTYPIEENIVREFLPLADSVILIEEKRGFLEAQITQTIKTLYQEGKISSMPAVWGKKLPGADHGVPETRGLNASVLIERLAPLLKNSLNPRNGETMAGPADESKARKIEEELAILERTAQPSITIPARTPTFCPGCPHRDSSSVSLEIKRAFKDAAYMEEKHGRRPTDVIFHGESGCHSMLQFAPNEGLMQNYSGMGLGGGTGAGMSPFIKNKQVVFLGDSTFFHSGVIAISDSLKNNQDITYIILENKTTAMTGHQPTPGNDVDLTGKPTFAQDIEKVIVGMTGGKIPVYRMDPSARREYRNLLEEVILEDGVKVVIADKECGITLHRRKRRQEKTVVRATGFLPLEEKINITPEVCEYCLECTKATGCPGLTIEETPYGKKIVTDLSTCVSDGACTRVKVCPSFEKIVIERKKAPVRKKRETFNLPEARRPDFEGTWYAYTAGVGGMGAGVVTAVLVRAGFKQGHHVLFLDKKGLAIRNGGVYGHVAFCKNNPNISPVVPYGKADLLLGIDLLEAARGMDPQLNLRVMSPSKTSAVINTQKTPTVLTLLGREDFNPDQLLEAIRQHCRPGQTLAADFSTESEKWFGSKLYANVMLLGAAHQRGLIPVSLDNMVWAISETVPRQDLEENLGAFHFGRRMAEEQRQEPEAGRKKSALAVVIEEKMRNLVTLYPLMGRRAAWRYKQMTDNAHRWMNLDDAAHVELARRIYDLICYENLALAQSYLERVWQTYRRDRGDLGYAATKVVIHNLYKVTAIKDEVFVAHLLTSPEKRARDRDRYRIDPSNGDRLRYIHFNRPQFTIFGRNIEFDINTRDWMLNIMKRMKILRKFLAGWHTKERAFRDWYGRLVDNFNYFENEGEYKLFVQALELPDQVRGYRAIRYPQMEEAHRTGEKILREIEEQRGQPSPLTPLPSGRGGL
jgi:indolepyruvate ferredoxin oxidoreductase